MKHDHQPMKARDLRMRIREWCRPSLAREGEGGGGHQMDAGAADAKLRVFSFSDLTQPDKGDPGATLDGLQGRNFASSQKQRNKMPNANEERIK